METISSTASNGSFSPTMNSSLSSPASTTSVLPSSTLSLNSTTESQFTSSDLPRTGDYTETISSTAGNGNLTLTASGPVPTVSTNVSTSSASITVVTAKVSEIILPSYVNIINGKPRVLICDGFETHETLEVLEFCLENNIILCRLPSHTSPKLQPCEVGPFAPLKTAYRDEVERLNRGGIDTIGKEHLTSLVTV